MQNKKAVNGMGQKKDNRNDWIKMLEGWVVENTKNLTLSAIKEVKKRLLDFFEDIVEEFSRSVFSSFIILIGLIFLMVGLSILINDIIGISQGFGYLTVGILVVLLGVSTGKKDKKDN